MKTTQFEPGENDWRAGEACPQNHAANEQIRSRSCHWHSCRSKRNSNSAVTNELSGQRGRPLQYSPRKRVVCLPSRVRVQRESGSAHTLTTSVLPRPVSPPSPTHRPRLQAHARSCPCPVPALLRSSTRSCNSHGPHALAVRNTQSPGQAAPARGEATCGNGTVGMQGPDTHTGVVQKWDAAPRTCLRMQVVNAGRRLHAAGARAGSGPPRERACDAHSHHDRTTRLPVHARHIGAGAEAARVRIPNGGAQRGGRRRRQGFC